MWTIIAHHYITAINTVVYDAGPARRRDLEVRPKPVEEMQAAAQHRMQILAI